MKYPYEEMITNHLDVRTRAGIEWQCLCPFHDDSSPSFSVNIAKGLFICYACGAKGNGEALAKKLGMAVAHSLPDDIDGLIAKIEQFEMSSHKVPYKRIDGDVWTTRYRIGNDWQDFWKERMGSPFSLKLADDFALGYDHIHHSLIIPIFDWDGSAEGSVKRKLGQFDGPKYLYSKGFKTSQHLYGAWQVRAAHTTKRPKKVAVVEGTIDALSMWAVGIPAVALLGSQVSAAQRKLFQRIDAFEYVVMTDRDAAGAKAGMLVEQAIRGTGSLLARPSYWQDGCKDVAEMTPEDRVLSFESSSVNTLTMR